jgi:hypothetical protein
MNEYKVNYHEGNKLGVGDDWFQTVSAETPEQAYRKFIQEVGVFAEIVYVEDTAFFGGLTEFSNHVEEAEKRVQEEKAQTGEHPQESADRENSTAQSNQMIEDMRKYNCEYEDYSTLDYGVPWRKKINATSHKEAYEKYLKDVGIYPQAVQVWTSLLSKSLFFRDHVASAMEKQRELAEKKKIIKEEKEIIVANESFNEQISEITKKQGLNKPESSTEKLLIKIIDLQQNQFDELKKLNFKLMMFWIFLVVLPLLGWLLTQ